MILAGYTWGSYALYYSGSDNRQAAAVMLSTSASAETSSPTPAPSDDSDAQDWSFSSQVYIIVGAVSLAAFLSLMAVAVWRRRKRAKTKRIGTKASSRAAGGSDLRPRLGPPDFEHGIKPQKTVGTSRRAWNLSGYAPPPLARSRGWRVTKDVETTPDVRARHSSTPDVTRPQPSSGASGRGSKNAQGFGDIAIRLPRGPEGEEKTVDPTRGGRQRRSASASTATLRRPSAASGVTVSTTSTVSSRQGFTATNRSLPSMYSSDGPIDRVASVRGQNLASFARPPVGVVEAVLDVAQELADNSAVPGICEVATLMSVLLQLVSDHGENAGVGEMRIRWCRSIIVLLERAEGLLGKVRFVSGSNGAGNSMPFEGLRRRDSIDVHFISGLIHHRIVDVPTRCNVELRSPDKLDRYPLECPGWLWSLCVYVFSFALG